MRVQLDFPAEKIKELKALMEKAEIKTYNQLFNNALTLMKWSIQEVEKGRIVGSFDDQEKKLKELAMPFLEAVASKRTSSPLEIDPPIAVGSR